MGFNYFEWNVRLLSLMTETETAAASVPFSSTSMQALWITSGIPALVYFFS